jgi:hypothetical protein
MLDAMFFGQPDNISANQSDWGSPNQSNAIVGVSKNNIGLRVMNRDSADVGANLQGRISIGMIEVAVAGLVLFYIWTHNVQGGG